MCDRNKNFFSLKCLNLCFIAKEIKTNQPSKINFKQTPFEVGLTQLLDKSPQSNKLSSVFLNILLFQEIVPSHQKFPKRC